MKPTHILKAVTTGALVALTSCSLPLDGGKPRLAKLKVGNLYEVRPAIASSSYFEPNGTRSMFFVYQPEPPPAPVLSRSATGSQLAVRTTAYTHSEDDHLIYGRRSALGSTLKFGSVRSAAADWSRYPVGTKFAIAGQPGVIYEVDDYGSALVGTNTIDLYCPTRSMMNQWGARNVGIQVLEWGSYERSAELMKARVHFPHVRRMFNDILSRGLVNAEHKQQASKPQPKLVFQAPESLRAPHLAMSL